MSGICNDSLNSGQRKEQAWKGQGMNLEEKIKRINELYHKSQKEGLTEEEKEEQKTLRTEYAASVRSNLRAQLDDINIQEKDGSVTNLGKKYGKRE